MDITVSGEVLLPVDVVHGTSEVIQDDPVYYIYIYKYMFFFFFFVCSSAAPLSEL